MASLKIMERVEDFGNRLITLVNAHITYYKIAAYEQVMSVLSILVSKAILMLTFLISSLFFSVWFAFFIGEWIGKPSLGFLIVGFLNLIAGYIIYLNRNKLIIDPMVRELSKLIVKQEESDHEGTEAS